MTNKKRIAQLEEDLRAARAQAENWKDLTKKWKELYGKRKSLNETQLKLLKELDGFRKDKGVET